MRILSLPYLMLMRYRMNRMLRGPWSVVTMIAILFALGMAGAGADQAGAVLTGLVIVPASPHIHPGAQQQISAIGTYSDSTYVDLTSVVDWQSSNTTVASIDNTGTATSAGPGSASLIATFNTFSTETVVTVPSVIALEITPANCSIDMGTALQLRATAAYSDGSCEVVTGNVVWATSNAAIAPISAAASVSAVKPGSITISAAAWNFTTSIKLTIAAPETIVISPADITIGFGTKQQFTATGVFSDGTSHDISSLVDWNSSASVVAVINTNGLASSNVPGVTNITASVGTVEGTARLTVSDAHLVSLSIGPADKSILYFQPLQMTATGTFSDNRKQDLTSQVTWSSSDPSAVTLSDTGLATATGNGNTSYSYVTISASYGSISASIKKRVLGPVQ